MSRICDLFDTDQLDFQSSLDYKKVDKIQKQILQLKTKFIDELMLNSKQTEGLESFQKSLEKLINSK